MLSRLHMRLQPRAHAVAAPSTCGCRHAAGRRVPRVPRARRPVRQLRARDPLAQTQREDEFEITMEKKTRASPVTGRTAPYSTSNHRATPYTCQYKFSHFRQTQNTGNTSSIYSTAELGGPMRDGLNGSAVQERLSLVLGVGLPRGALHLCEERSRL